jgi:hypothetical protein
MAAGPSGGGPGAWQSSLPGRVVITVAFLALNLTLNLLNKWFLSLYGGRSRVRTGVIAPQDQGLGAYARMRIAGRAGIAAPRC